LAEVPRIQLEVLAEPILEAAVAVVLKCQVMADGVEVVLL
jgi:hypothetical protein